MLTARQIKNSLKHDQAIGKVESGTGTADRQFGRGAGKGNRNISQSQNESNNRGVSISLHSSINQQTGEELFEIKSNVDNVLEK